MTQRFSGAKNLLQIPLISLAVFPNSLLIYLFIQKFFVRKEKEGTQTFGRVILLCYTLPFVPSRSSPFLF